MSRSDFSFWRLLEIVIGSALLLLGLIGLLRSFHAPIIPHDEGILLTDSLLILEGKLPHRQFYSCYPSGMYLVIAAMWELIGISVLVERSIGFFLHLAISGLAGYLCGRITERGFSVICAGFVLIWLNGLESVAFHWLGALALSLLFCAVCLNAKNRLRWLLAGFLLASVSFFRHDLFVYYLIFLSLFGIVYLFRHPTFDEIFGKARWFSVGFVVPLIFFWGITISGAGFTRVYEDLYETQVKYVMPGRVRPFPPLLKLRSVPPLPFKIPNFLSERLPSAVVFNLAGPSAGVLMLLFSRQLKLMNREPLLLTTALSMAVLPQMFGRTDTFHALFTITPTLILFCSLAGALSSQLRGYLSLGLMLMFVGILMLPIRINLLPGKYPVAQGWQSRFSRYGNVPDRVPEREQVLEFIADHTKAGEPVYIGLTDHRRILMNEIDLYYLCDRPGATRYMQFEPNVINAAHVQKGMIDEINSRNVKAVVLSDRYTKRFEPNESSNFGASLLDDFIKANFRVVKEAGYYKMLLRKKS